MQRFIYSVFLSFTLLLNSPTAKSQSDISPPTTLTIELLDEIPASTSNASVEPFDLKTTEQPIQNKPGCFESWDPSEAMVLENRLKRLLESPHRTGFGSNATGGIKNLKVVTNAAATGSGTYADVINNAVPGDYIIFDPSNTTYLNSLTGNGSVLPESVTVDGALPNGQFVTLKGTNSAHHNMVRLANGNNILANIYFDQSNDAAAVAVGHGENYWLHCFRISGQDSSLSIGNQVSNLTNSATNVTVSRYQVLSDTDKGFLTLSAGNSCSLPNGGFDPKATGSNSTAQRRAYITLIDSELSAGTRNILNKGAYVDIVGTYIHGRVENTVTRYGGQTAIRCSYIDSRTIRYQSIRADGGQYSNGESNTAPAECPQQSEIFLDNNIYRQPNFTAESTDPRIDIDQSDNTTNELGHMTDRLENWQNPASGRPVFERPYGNLMTLCTTPEATSLTDQ